MHTRLGRLRHGGVAWPKALLWALSSLGVLAAAVACSSSPAVTPVPTTTPFPTTAPLPGAPELSLVVGTTDHGVGSNRVVFGLIDRQGNQVQPSDEVPVRALYLPDGDTAGEVRAAAAAEFRPWPIGRQGVFATTLEFDQVGYWELQVDATAPNGKSVTATAYIQVRPETSTPSIGDPAPASVTPTGDGVDDLGTITSSPQPDADLYRLSVHEALDDGRPLVLVFATPAFCSTATCGPQVAVLSELNDRWSARAYFIHVEVYENPHLIGESQALGELVEAVAEWGLPTEPWTFIVDGKGLVRAKFEGFVTLEELEEGLADVLGS